MAASDLSALTDAGQNIRTTIVRMLLNGQLNRIQIMPMFTVHWRGMRSIDDDNDADGPLCNVVGLN